MCVWVLYSIHLCINVRLPGYCAIGSVLVGGGKLNERVALKETSLWQLMLCTRLRHSMAKRLQQSLWQLTPHTEKNEGRVTMPHSQTHTHTHTWFHTFAFASLFEESPNLQDNNSHKKNMEKSQFEMNFGCFSLLNMRYIKHSL